MSFGGSQTITPEIAPELRPLATRAVEQFRQLGNNVPINSNAITQFDPVDVAGFTGLERLAGRGIGEITAQTNPFLQQATRVGPQIRSAVQSGFEAGQVTDPAQDAIRFLGSQFDQDSNLLDTNQASLGLDFARGPNSLGSRVDSNIPGFNAGDINQFNAGIDDKLSRDKFRTDISDPFTLERLPDFDPLPVPLSGRGFRGSDNGAIDPATGLPFDLSGGRFVDIDGTFTFVPDGQDAGGGAAGQDTGGGSGGQAPPPPSNITPFGTNRIELGSRPLPTAEDTAASRALAGTPIPGFNDSDLALSLGLGPTQTQTPAPPPNIIGVDPNRINIGQSGPVGQITGSGGPLAPGRNIFGEFVDPANNPEGLTTLGLIPL